MLVRKSARPHRTRPTTGVIFITPIFFENLYEKILIRIADTLHEVLCTFIIVSRSLLLNPLNPELNPICYLLALLAHHFLHVNRIRVKSLTLR